MSFLDPKVAPIRTALHPEGSNAILLRMNGTCDEQEQRCDAECQSSCEEVGITGVCYVIHGFSGLSTPIKYSDPCHAPLPRGKKYRVPVQRGEPHQSAW